MTRRRRFAFGANWAAFLERLTPERIAEAERSLREMLGRDRLDGLAFLDVGSGSGLFSLAARRLGARVTSFDFDQKSVACTEELRRRYAPDEGQWAIFEGSALDEALMARLADGFLALPGGIGTLDELFEIWTWRQLGLHAKPVGLLDAEGFFGPLVAFLDRLVEEGFLLHEQRSLLEVEADPAALVDRLTAAAPPAYDPPHPIATPTGGSRC